MELEQAVAPRTAKRPNSLNTRSIGLQCFGKWSPRKFAPTILQKFHDLISTAATRSVPPLDGPRMQNPPLQALRRCANPKNPPLVVAL
jgi:hypothetical protein